MKNTFFYLKNLYFKLIWQFVYKLEQVSNFDYKVPLYLKFLDWSIYPVALMSSALLFFKTSHVTLFLSSMGFIFSIIYLVAISFKLYARRLQIQLYKQNPKLTVSEIYYQINEKIVYFDSQKEKYQLERHVKNQSNNPDKEIKKNKI